MQLFLMEKPSVARAVAAILAPSGARRGDGYIDCGRAVVSWCFGHLLQPESPEHYAGGRIDLSALPVIPKRWEYSPRPDAAKQLRIIRGLLAKADEVVHGGDPDREGQLLVDEVLEHLGYRGTVRRIWLSAVDPASVRKALGSLRDNREMRNLSQAAAARQKADWLSGMNGSIAVSRLAQAKGSKASWSVGRVQTPTLALLVRRKEEIDAFVPREFYRVMADLESAGKTLTAWWKMPEDLAGVEDGRLFDRDVAETVARRVEGKVATCQTFSKRTVSREAPLPHCLSTLQREANARYGLSAKSTLDAAQRLYEGGILTYPRTDCQYLPQEQHGAAPKVLQAIAAAGIRAVGCSADPARKHPAFNDKNITAHHAIVPTGQSMPHSASGPERQVFELVAAAYLRLFLPPEVVEERKATFNLDGLIFAAGSRSVKDAGWRAVGAAGAQSQQAKQEEKEDDGKEVEESSTPLPDLRVGDQLRCSGSSVDARQTQRPKPYTDGTLIAAMTRIHSIAAPQYRDRLRETSGLGTEATRAAIIETLVSRNYTIRVKKQILPTEKGVALVRCLRGCAPILTMPELTAMWEDALSDVAEGKIPASKFLEVQSENTRSIVGKLRGATGVDQLCEAERQSQQPLTRKGAKKKSGRSKRLLMEGESV